VQAINARGVMVGSTWSVTEDQYGVLWTSPPTSPLKLTPFVVLGGFVSANDINDAGVVIGDWQPGHTYLNTRVWRWTPHGGFEDLGQPHGLLGVHLAKVNNAGVIVGFASLLRGSPATVAIRLVDTTFTDLNTLIDIPTHQAWNLEEATGITDSGVIVGNGTFQGVPHGWMLIPIHKGDDNDQG
jgi:hypothetical protein